MWPKNVTAPKASFGDEFSWLVSRELWKLQWLHFTTYVGAIICFVGCIITEWIGKLLRQLYIENSIVKAEKALLSFRFFFPGRVSSCPAIVFSSLLWVLGFRQTKTCQAKWTLIAFKPKLSSFCVVPNGWCCYCLRTEIPFISHVGQANRKLLLHFWTKTCQNFGTSTTTPPTRFMTFAVDIFSPKKSGENNLTSNIGLRIVAWQSIFYHDFSTRLASSSTLLLLLL